MTTITVNYSWQMPDPGGSANTWGNILNATTQAIDAEMFNNFAQISNIEANYLPLSGGVLTGPLTPDPVQGLVGTQTNDNAAAGSVGEWISATAAPGSVGLSSTIVNNVTSIALTQGDWEAWGYVGVTPTTGATLVLGAVSGALENAAWNRLMPVGFRQRRLYRRAGNANSRRSGSPSPQAPLPSVFLIARCDFTSGSASAYGQLNARRIR